MGNENKVDTTKLSVKEIDRKIAREMIIENHYSHKWTKCSVALGLFYSDGKEEIYLQATPVKAIDTTGAGDAFNGGLAFGLSKEKPIKECLELANKVAGISTTKLGAGDAMPFIKDLS